MKKLSKVDFNEKKSDKTIKIVAADNIGIEINGYSDLKSIIWNKPDINRILELKSRLIDYYSSLGFNNGKSTFKITHDAMNKLGTIWYVIQTSGNFT